MAGPSLDRARRRTAALMALSALVLAGTAQSAAPADPYTGHWKLNLAASGGDARSQELTIKVEGNRETYRSELRLKNGTRQVTNYTAAYDGKEHPSQTVGTDAAGVTTTRDDTVILRKIDERTRERHWKQGGRIVRILRRVVSADGKTLRSQVIEVDANGTERPTGTLVFDRS